MRRKQKNNKGSIILIMLLILIIGILLIKLYIKDENIANSRENNNQVTEKDDNKNKDNESETNEKKENGAISILGIDKYENDSLAIVLNRTDNYNVKNDNLNVEYFEKDSIGEELAVIPRYVGSKVTFYSLAYEEDELKEDEKLYEIESINSNNSIIVVKAQIPCGMPNLKVVIENGQEKAEYIFSYDGKGDRATIENIFKIKN